MILLALLLQTVDTAKARAIHDRVMTLDTHVDITPAKADVGSTETDVA